MSENMNKSEEISYIETEKRGQKRVPILKSKRKKTQYVRILKPEVLPLQDGVYLYYPEGEKYIALSGRTSPYNDKEYVFMGRLEPGEIKILRVEGKERTYLPLHGEWNYGYTLEGDAKALFHVSKALLDYNAKEDRSFAYVSTDSKLYFAGREGTYLITLRLFGDFGKEGNRWAVLYLQKQD